MDGLNSQLWETYASKVHNCLARAFAVAEARAPAGIAGSFIPAGGAFDALVAVGKVLKSAKQDLLIVDPYLDEVFFTDFAGLAAAGVRLRVLADAFKPKPTLDTAAKRWVKQYGAQRPMDARLSSKPRALHDRCIIVDGNDAWSLSQSFGHFAARSPAEIMRNATDVAPLKIAAYEAEWNAAQSLI